MFSIKESKIPGIYNVLVAGKYNLSQAIKLNQQLSEFSTKNRLTKRFLIVDLRKCNLMFTPDDFKPYIDAANNSISENQLQFVRTAFITAEPKETAMLTYFCSNEQLTSTKRKVFSTEIAAIEWLQKKQQKSPV